ncbi:MAG: alpha/beta fold hydrolase [Deinococcus sp.]|nr:alpha/beta fold hydrolase [Deinococcus sp.]
MKRSGWLLLEVLWLSGCGQVSERQVSLPVLGFTIAGTYRPAPGRHHPALVLLHQLGGSRADLAEVGKALAHDGYPSLAIDLRGHGESTKFQGAELTWDNMSTGLRRWATQDVEAAVTFLREQTGVDPERIAIFGASLGANVAINYAAADPLIPTVILLSPGLEYQGIDTREAVAASGSRPILMVSSEEDSYAYQSTEALMGLAASPHSLQLVLPGAAHGLDLLDDALYQDILQWLGLYVRGAPEEELPSEEPVSPALEGAL